MTGSDLAAITDLTSGAITGVVARLERAGYLRREPDPHDRRQQILYPALERMRDIHDVFDPIRKDVAALLESFDTHQLTAIAEFLTRSTEFAYRHVALLRAQTHCAASRTGGTAQAPDPGSYQNPSGTVSEVAPEADLKRDGIENSKQPVMRKCRHGDDENRPQQTKAMTMKRFNWIMLAGFGLVLLIAAHGLVAWGGIKLSGKIGGWLPWIAGGALMAFGLYHVIQHIRGKGHGHSHLFGGHAHDRGEVERGPHDGFLVNLGHGFVEITIFETDVPPRFRLFFHDKHKQARSVPANATVKLKQCDPTIRARLSTFTQKVNTSNPRLTFLNHMSSRPSFKCRTAATPILLTKSTFRIMTRPITLRAPPDWALNWDFPPPSRWVIVGFLLSPPPRGGVCRPGHSPPWVGGLGRYLNGCHQSRDQLTRIPRIPSRRGAGRL